MSAQSTDFPRWTRFVAIGDSFTEGLWDVDPDDAERLRGWADILATTLSHRRTAAGEPPLEYANLAVRGRLLRPIISDQVPAAIGLAPDLVSLIGGGNDILRPTADVDRMARNLEAAVVRLRASGADVLLGTGMDTADSPLMRHTRARIAVYNSHIWSIARRQGAYVLDLWGMRALHDLRLWADDRIHLTTEGHGRVAQGALVALGLAPDDASWDDSLAPLSPAPRVERVMKDAVWLREYVYPWATHRLRGTSSGDLLMPKRPELTPASVVGAIAAALPEEHDSDAVDLGSGNGSGLVEKDRR